jgi:predicted MFS family arabinose efflux permease
VAEPVIPLRLFRSQSFRIACAISLVVGIGMFGAISFLPTYLQIVTGVSATGSGLLLLPLIGGLLVTSITSGRLIARTGRYKAYPVAGTALAGVGLYLLSTMGVRTSHLASSLYLLVLGLGIGLFLQVMVLIVQNRAARRDLGAATSSVSFARQVGSGIGVALVGALFIHRHVIASAFATALPPIYAYLIPLLAAAFLLALILREIPLHTRADQDAADAPDAPDGAQAAPPPARARPQGAAATIPGTPRQGAGSHHRPRPGRGRATALGRRQASRLPVLTRRKIPPGR